MLFTEWKLMIQEKLHNTFTFELFSWGRKQRSIKKSEPVLSLFLQHLQCFLPNVPNVLAHVHPCCCRCCTSADGYMILSVLGCKQWSCLNLQVVTNQGCTIARLIPPFFPPSQNRHFCLTSLFTRGSRFHLNFAWNPTLNCFTIVLKITGTGSWTGFRSTLPQLQWLHALTGGVTTVTAVDGPRSVCLDERGREVSVGWRFGLCLQRGGGWGVVGDFKLFCKQELEIKHQSCSWV